uniref:Uncharacterized protein n=1 Tax=Oryza barthii TaxID=65489 RepID=A0A0D3GHV3_9ORYZ
MSKEKDDIEAKQKGETEKEKGEEKQSFSRYTFAKKYSMNKDTLKISSCWRISQCVVEGEYDEHGNAWMNLILPFSDSSKLRLM